MTLLHRLLKELLHTEYPLHSSYSVFSLFLTSFLDIYSFTAFSNPKTLLKLKFQDSLILLFRSEIIQMPFFFHMYFPKKLFQRTFWTLIQYFSMVPSPFNFRYLSLITVHRLFCNGYLLFKLNHRNIIMSIRKKTD